MNYFLLAETDFFRRINEAGDCNMEKAYTAFATQVIELCIGSGWTHWGELKGVDYAEKACK